MCVCVRLRVCVYSETDRSRVRPPCVCVDVFWMFYAAEPGEPGAINKTGLQWQNHLSDSGKEKQDKEKRRKRRGECKTDEGGG